MLSARVRQSQGPKKPYAALPLTWAAVVLLLTLTPAVDMPRTPAWELMSFDTAAHAGVFAVLAFLSWFSLRRQRRWQVLARYASVVVLLSCFLFGALIEVLQYTMNVGRHAEWLDLIGDTLGAAVALGLLAVLPRGVRRWVMPDRPVVVSVLAVGLAASLLAPKVSVAQDMVRARHTIGKLASRSMHGRGYVKQGEHKAAAYLRRRFRELRLEPLAPDYTQPFTLDVNTFPGKLNLRFIDGYSRILRPGIDFIVAPESAAFQEAWSHPFELDTLIFTDTAAVRRMVRPAALMGRVGGIEVSPKKLPKGRQIASLLIRARDEARIPGLPPEAQAFLSQFQLRLVLHPKLTASVAPSQSSVTRLLINQEAWPAGFCYPGGATPSIRLTIDAQLQSHYQTQNLAAVIRGSVQPDSFLVVTAHYDHLGMMGRRAYFPGANDNASGVAMLLELAAYYAKPENRPACSIAFLLFGAEEAGLVGSRYFVQHPLLSLPRIRFLLNLDLLGTGEEGITVVNGKLLPAAFAQLERLNATSHYLSAIGARGRAANSDHFPFSEAGVPAFFIYTRGGSKAYHDVNDQPGSLSLAGFRGVFGLLRGFMAESGTRSAKP